MTREKQLNIVANAFSITAWLGRFTAIRLTVGLDRLNFFVNRRAVGYPSRPTFPTCTSPPLNTRLQRPLRSEKFGDRRK